MKKLGFTPQNLRDLCILAEIVNPKEPMKYSELEMASALGLFIAAQDRRIEKATTIYKDMKKKLDVLQEPKLWSFKPPNSVPDGEKTNYLAKLTSGQIRPVDEMGKVLMVKKNK